MKKHYISLILLIFSIFTCGTYSVKAQEVNNAEIIERLFDGFEDTDELIKLPNGGYLYGQGQAKVYEYLDYLDGNMEPTVIYEISGNDNKITVEEAKKEMENNVRIPQQRGSSVPTQVMQLAAGQVYISNTFSGSGWRFSGYQFLANPNTGYYLKWTTYADDGRVGNASMAMNTLKGQLSGIAIYKNQSKSINYGPNGQIYYTYNPVNGTYYRVENN